jgi:hypothetical protein
MEEEEEEEVIGNKFSAEIEARSIFKKLPNP